MTSTTKRLKIFYVIDDYVGPSGGTEKQLLMLIRGMQTLGHRVRLFVLRHTAYTRSVSDFPCPIECLEIHSIRSFAAMSRMRAFHARVTAERADVVHAFFNDSAILVPLHCTNTSALVLTSRRDMGFWYNRLNLLLLWVANRRADRIVCNCAAVAAEVGRREGISREKLAVIYNGLTLDAHPREFLPSTAMRAGGDIDSDRSELRICLLANLRPIKRMEDFIRAAARMSERAPCRFLVVGESLSASYERELRQIADELALGDKLEFTGPVAEPMRLLRGCHVGVLTSESEGLSNAILEYMAAGLPVVCSDVGGNGELVECGHNGYLYPCGDVEALAVHLGRLCTDAAERHRMGAASLQRARDFSPERMIESHLQVYTRKGFTHG